MLLEGSEEVTSRHCLWSYFKQSWQLGTSAQQLNMLASPQATRVASWAPSELVNSSHIAGGAHTLPLLCQLICSSHWNDFCEQAPLSVRKGDGNEPYACREVWGRAGKRGTAPHASRCVGSAGAAARQAGCLSAFPSVASSGWEVCGTASLAGYVPPVFPQKCCAGLDTTFPRTIPFHITCDKHVSSKIPWRQKANVESAQIHGIFS